jgi:HEAT repeat protein
MAVLGGAALAAFAAGAGTAQDAGPSTADLLRLSAQETPAGVRARALVINEAGKRAEEIIKLLRDGDDDVRAAAAWMLRNCSHPQAVPALVAAMRDAHFTVARTAVMTLKEKKAADAPLAAMLSDKDPAMRWRAACNIAHASVSGAAPALLKLVASDDAEYVRIEAIGALPVAPSADAAVALAACFADANERIRDAAAASFDSVLAKLDKKDQAGRARVVEALLAVLEKHADKPHAVKLAVDRLSAIALAQLGNDPVKWRKVLTTQPAQEGGK